MFSLYTSYILYLIAMVFCYISHYAEKQFIDATRPASVLRSSVEAYLNQWRSCLFSNNGTNIRLLHKFNSKANLS